MISIKRIIKKLANILGFEIRRIPGNTQEYELVRPMATYSPWNTDRQFHEVYRIIKKYTQVDLYRCYELWRLVRQSAKLGGGGGIIEVGVWRGGTGALIAKQALNYGKNDKVYLCDTFTGVVKAGRKDSFYRGGEHADARRDDVEKLIGRMGLKNVHLLEGIFPDDTGHEIEHLTFRFCHIDVDVYQSAKDIVEWIWPRMLDGGIIVYDDYGFKDCNGITLYVEEQLPLEDRIILHNLNGHAIAIKLERLKINNEQN